MYPYFMVLFSIFFLYFNKLKYGRHIAFLLLFLFSALRFDVGFDYQTYYEVVAGYNDYEYERFGIFDKLIIDAARALDFYQFYFIATSFLICFFIWRTIYKYSSDFYLSILLFFVVPIFYLNSLTIIRQFIALSLIFYSIHFVFKKNLIAFIFFISIASIFHISALVGIFIYWLPKVRFSTRKVILLFLIAYAAYVLVDKELASYVPIYSYYLQGADGNGKSMMYFLLVILIFVSLNKFQSKEAHLYYNIYVFGVVSYCFFINFGEVGPRVSLYYLIFMVLLIPDVLNKKSYKKFYPLLFLLFTILLYFNFHLSAKDVRKDQYVPYNNFLSVNVNSYKWKSE